MKKNNIILIAIGALVATATALLFYKMQEDESEEKPPKGAPQLDIENPGTQDEFPNAPRESEIG